MKKGSVRNIEDILPRVQQVLLRPRPALSNALRSGIPEICANHVARLRAELPSARGLDDDALQDDLDVILEALAEGYEQVDGLNKLALLGPAHAAARHGQLFHVEDVINEHVLLRDTLREAAARHLRRELDRDEQEAIDAGVDLILAGTVKSFVVQREARLQLETNALTHFLTAVSHELRNELNGVMTSMHGLVETGALLRPHLAQSSANNATVSSLEDLLQDVNECRRAMASSINAMSRLLEAERLRKNVTASPRAVQLSKLLDGAIRSAARMDRGDRPDISHAAERIKRSCPETLQLWTDPDVLGTVLVNLIGNAVKYAPNGEIEVTAHVSTNQECEITIVDHGPGVPREQVQALFDAFQRGAHPNIEGVGLGLYIARRAAELLGAQLEVNSEPGRGSQFRLHLPAAAALPRVAGPDETPGRSATVGGGHTAAGSPTPPPP